MLRVPASVGARGSGAPASAGARGSGVPDEITLAVRDHGAPAAGPAVPVLLLHGLAGHVGEWDDLAARLTATGRYHVLAYDARGHGASTRRPPEVTRSAHVQDAAAVVRLLGLRQPVVLGQSLGGHTAMLAAAAHPDLFRALVLVDAGPGGPQPDLPARIDAWMAGWPDPFPSREAATDLLGSPVWADGLEPQPDGTLRARVDRDVMVACVAEHATRAFWPEWRAVTCPTLLVRGGAGPMPESEAAEMRALRPGLRAVTVPDAGHDVHLDAPAALFTAVTEFLEDLPPR
ncbi:alpha/beta fold hydrolase [Streptomyces sp. NPDC060194]|uniref:alpha/beta fold hydrolase n=1 Tax=Streptomyces sp. NPDC060194 TaxID=3347069 RepID=UPI00366661FF